MHRERSWWLNHIVKIRFPMLDPQQQETALEVAATNFDDWVWSASLSGGSVLVDGLCLRDILPEACQKLKGYQAVGWDMAHPIRQAAHFGTQFRTPQGDIVLGPDGWRALAPRGMAVRKDGRLVAFDAREAICPTREEAYRRLLAAKG